MRTAPGRVYGFSCVDVEMSLGEAKSLPQPHQGHAATEWESGFKPRAVESQMARLSWVTVSICVTAEAPFVLKTN